MCAVEVQPEKITSVGLKSGSSSYDTNNLWLDVLKEHF